MKEISDELYAKLKMLGIIESEETRSSNVGNSNYSRFTIQPWSIWIEYELNPFDADIVKRVLRTKIERGQTYIQSRISDYYKIIHVCEERIRQLTDEADVRRNEIEFENVN